MAANQPGNVPTIESYRSFNDGFAAGKAEAADRIEALEAALADISSGIQYTEHGLRGIARRALADIKQGNAR